MTAPGNFCRSCGKGLLAHEQFCRGCGAPVAPARPPVGPQSAPFAPPRSSSASTIVVVAIAAVAVVVLAVGAAVGGWLLLASPSGAALPPSPIVTPTVPAPSVAPAADPFAASIWRGEVRTRCDDSPFDEATDNRAAVEIQTRRISATQIELRLSEAPGHLERTIITLGAGGPYAGSGHGSEDDTVIGTRVHSERDVTIAFRDGHLHFDESSVSTNVSVTPPAALPCRKTAVLAPSP